MPSTERAITDGVYADYIQSAGILGFNIGMPAHRQPLCAELSMLAQSRFRSSGRSAELMLHASENVAHYFVRLPNGLLVDLTWQQFLPESRRLESLPRALIAPQDEAIGRLGRFGVPKRRLTIWEDAHPSMHRWQALGNPVLKAILES